jgi:hypothetical protein
VDIRSLSISIADIEAKKDGIWAVLNALAMFPIGDSEPSHNTIIPH